MGKLEDIEARWKRVMEFGPSYASTGQGNAYEPPEKKLIEEDIPALIEMVRALAEYADPENWSEDEKWFAGEPHQTWNWFGSNDHPANIARKVLSKDAL